MSAVGIRELKNRLSEYVQLAASGERILVTDRDKVVAELSAPRTGTAGDVSDAVIADLIRQGLATPPLVRDELSPAKPRSRLPLAAILADLDADRDDR